jgi:hypothetical protein
MTSFEKDGIRAFYKHHPKSAKKTFKSQQKLTGKSPLFFIRKPVPIEVPVYPFQGLHHKESVAFFYIRIFSI